MLDGGGQHAERGRGVARDVQRRPALEAQVRGARYAAFAQDCTPNASSPSKIVEINTGVSPAASITAHGATIPPASPTPRSCR
ncbi:hypothetical protein [Burkholderia orbicola]|uniref:hypothetical protein n=1 Tax=Burkholderia orbicola TaxID=2978683 RepID=UPI002650114A|nr:hypothetical protein [Burkholderia orbicola]MDN7775824.1 hypothetical protein [Burkholderia orbicola]